jgi:hypothetical protein
MVKGVLAGTATALYNLRYRMYLATETITLTWRKGLSGSAWDDAPQRADHWPAGQTGKVNVGSKLRRRGLTLNGTSWIRLDPNPINWTSELAGCQARGARSQLSWTYSWRIQRIQRLEVVG